SSARQPRGNRSIRRMVLMRTPAIPERGGRRYMTMKRKLVLPLALALGALGMMVVAQIAGATHARPKGATPVLVSLVPTYKQCTTATNRQHGPPLAALSCNPPVQTSA